MQKLSVEVLEKMFGADLSNHEIDMMLYIARFQDEFGHIRGVYYRDICENVGLSYQGFYDCLHSLERKGIIACEKRSYFDWDIQVINNSFCGTENFGRGYVSLHCGMVRSDEFKQLKGGAKLMALWLMREWLISRSRSGSSAYQITKENLIAKFVGLLNVSRRTVREYLGDLEPFMDVYLEKGRKYFITFKKGAYEALPGRDSENDELRNHTVTISCRRNRIKDENRQKEEEICTILKQHHKDIIKKLEFDLSAIIRESLARINASIHNKYKWKRYLNPALVHKIVIEELANA